MALEQTWRWFGPNDPVDLVQVKQTGATGIVTALHQVPVGEIWKIEEIQFRKQMIESAGLSWSVVESLPVHEHIKRRTANFDDLLENYKQSIRNIAACDIDTICYNFMPVLDWSRTNLKVELPDGSISSGFEEAALAAFDLFLLKRPGAEDDYDDPILLEAKRRYEHMSAADKGRLEKTVLLGLPGSLESYGLESLRKAIAGYQSLSEPAFRENLYSFIQDISPVAEEAGIRLAIHPDDPPWPVLGLPRIVSTKKDFQQILEASACNANGLTFCAGSLGANRDHDLVEMAAALAHRIHFVHLRNVRCRRGRNFFEDAHLNGHVDMVGVIRELLLEQRRRIRKGRPDFRLPMRPDHGQLLHLEKNNADIYPGYSFIGRLKGLAEIRGVEQALLRTLDADQ